MSKECDILIIDDEQVVVDAVVKICSAEQLTVDSAIDARVALKKLDKNRYRLIICDIMMPELDGFQFLEKLTNVRVDTPVIMTTGYSTVENAVKSLQIGAVDFIPKPFTADELMSSVHRGLRLAAIPQMLVGSQGDIRVGSIPYVPCPTKYFRLGGLSWAVLDHAGSALVGATDLFLKTVESVGEIELFALDDEIVQGSSCAKIKSKDGLVHQMLASVSGRIIERNDLLVADPTIIERDPYFEGWLYRVIPSDIDYEFKHLIAC